MKRVIIFLMVSTLLLNTGCGDFLDTENLTKKDSSNFPTSPTDALQSLYGAYSIMLKYGGDVESPIMLSRILSDDHFGGGGQNDTRPQAVNVFRTDRENMWHNTWKYLYEGIFRCNMLISTVDQIEDWDSQEQKNKIMGEAYFLRGYYYFTMAQIWGTVPLVTEPTPQNNPRATAEELFGQILLDLKTAIELLPSQSQPVNEMGRASRWAAEAILARAYLFYDGYYQQNGRKDVSLADESTLTSAMVVTWLNDCINSSGHQLLSDFRNQWPYSIDIPQNVYPYKTENNLAWADEEGGNKENIFMIRYSSHGTHDNQFFNPLLLYGGLRDQALIPFGQGWGFATVNPKLYHEWPDHDLRKKGSIWNVNDPSEIADGYDYQFGGDMSWQETGFWCKKYMPFNVLDDNGEVVNYSVIKYGRVPDYKLDNSQDLVLVRFADVLLMHSELTRTTEGINQVRARAGLNPVEGYSDEVLRNERRYELAFEGLRYHDLLRWYGKEAGTILKQNMSGATIYNMGVATTINNDRNNGHFEKIDQRVRDTGGFMQIPQSEISLSEGVLTQNPGWEGSTANF